jgi:hypothetical protein
MSEELMSDITRDAIKSLLKKFPRKKEGFVAYCEDNSLLDMDELSEFMALEVLEMLDSASHIRVIRAKEAEKQRINHENLVLMLDEYLDIEKDTFMILDKVDNCYLLCKKINIRVQQKNDNNVFQPYETITAREYFINFIVKLTENYEPSELIKKFLTRLQSCKD